MPAITDIPVEVIIDNLLPVIPLVDLLSLACTSKFFALVCSDETFWQRKLQRDFNFSPTGIARTSGFKLVYKGLRRPRVFVWGDSRGGRLGHPKLLSNRVPGVPYPLELHIPGVRIVNLTACGMSFFALDSEGDIHVWGTMDGTTFALNADGFSESGKTSEVPRKLRMPTPTRNISCGRLHAATLDANQHVWTFLSFGRPFRLSSALMDKSSPDTTPLQVECGWNLTSVLTRSGNVLVWWPFDGRMRVLIDQKHEEMNSAGDKNARDADGIIPCVPWDLRFEPTQLPSLPALPKLAGSPDETSEPRLIQIAAIENHIIGLTDQGHVVKYGSLSGEDTYRHGQWHYLPNFSDVNMVRAHEAFKQPGDDQSDKRLPSPPTMKITHISAHFRHFVAYSTGSSSLVLMGDHSTGPADLPTIIPALQYQSVISVVVGDYHYGALTATGKLFTWGNFSRGALGLGDPRTLPIGSPGGFADAAQLQLALQRDYGEPPEVKVPTEVHFNHGTKHPRKRFCFSATASGWHTGALVIDLEPESQDSDDDTDAELTKTPGHQQTGPVRGGRFPVPLPRPPYHNSGPGQVPIMPLTHDTSSIFRVGFPGRGGTLPGLSQQGPSTPMLPPGQQETNVPEEIPYPTLGRNIRIGFAGRGMNRGRGQGDVNQ